ncbi:hypothetical protein J6590_050020 [Homalodisca vitripennis]|nr:hypothetical protein J6590_050020 [Homalodisca vitripennis]
MENELTKTKSLSKENWNCAKTVINYSRIKWGLVPFKPFKSTGADGIIPALLQESADLAISLLLRLFRTSLVTGVISRGPLGLFYPEARGTEKTDVKWIKNMFSSRRAQHLCAESQERSKRSENIPKSLWNIVVDDTLDSE